MKKILILCFIILIPQLANAQNNNPELIKYEPQNAALGTVSVGIVIYTASLSYERFLGSKTNYKSFARLTYGGYVALFDDAGSYINGQYGVLLFPGNHHLEASAGVNFFFNSDITNNIPLCGGIGYRFQKPSGNFILRTGVSWPEVLYLGVGFAF